MRTITEWADFLARSLRGCLTSPRIDVTPDAMMRDADMTGGACPGPVDIQQVTLARDEFCR